MKKALIRRVAVALIAVLTFAQASVVLAACDMDRGALRMASAPGGMDDTCCDMPELRAAPQLDNTCVAHCTADLQLAGLPLGLVPPPLDVAVLVLPRTAPAAAPELPPPPSIPRRILLHSFVI